jgi:N-acetylmuramoyl-L-alanine amidase
VILKTSMPAVLVETGFITNPSEAAKLVDSAYQLRMAEAIARGVDQFLKSYR